MRVPLVDLRREYESVREEVMPEIERVVSEAAFIKGEDLRKFEDSYASYCRADHCVGVKSGTAALFLAQKALGVEGEVVTVPNSFIATTESITQAGNRIRFVDVEPDTGLMDLERLQEVCSKKTKAVVPVHMYGQMVDVKAVRNIVGDDVRIIEDAAHAHGALYDGKPPGSYSDCACYSFYPAKNLGAYGDGGAVVTNDPGAAELLVKLRDHGRGLKDKYEHRVEGYNERLDNLQAAILNVKLKHLPGWVEKRRGVAERYNKLLNVESLKVHLHAHHSYYFYVIRSRDRDGLLEHLKSKGVGAGIHYPIPLHLLEAYKHLNLGEGTYPAAEKLSKTVLSLPTHPYLTDEEIEYVSEQVNAHKS